MKITVLVIGLSGVFNFTFLHFRTIYLHKLAISVGVNTT